MIHSQQYYHGVIIMKACYHLPHIGGKKIPPKTSSDICKRVNAYTETRPWHKKNKLKIRFRGKFCYLDVLEKEGDSYPMARLRHFDKDLWGLAFYTFNYECYGPCMFSKGKWFDTIEEAIMTCEVRHYFTERGRAYIR